jgi:hypothetical protein
MRKVLAIALMGGALIVSSTVAFAQTTATSDQPAVGHNGEYIVDQQITPYAPPTQTR